MNEIDTGVPFTSIPNNSSDMSSVHEFKDEDGNRFRLCYSPEEIIHATTIYVQRNGCLGYWRKL